MFFSLNNNLNNQQQSNGSLFGNVNNNNNQNNNYHHGFNGNNPFHNALPTPSPSASPSTPGVTPSSTSNGHRLLSAQGMETLQAFLREHGNECIKQFVKVIFSFLLSSLHTVYFSKHNDLQLLKGLHFISQACQNPQTR